MALEERANMSVNAERFVVGVVVTLTIVLYVIWLLSNRLRNKESKLKAFSERLKSAFDRILGL